MLAISRSQRDRDGDLSSRLRLTNAGDLSTVFAKRELLQEIGDVLAGRNEANFHSTVWTDGGHAADEA